MSTKTKPDQGGNFVLFAAASFDARLKLGAGCMLKLPSEDIALLKTINPDTTGFVSKNFTNITPTQLELKTIIWALETTLTNTPKGRLTICTGFKTVKDLLEKRARLEQTNYAGVKPNSLVVNADLFQQYYKLHDRLKFEVLYLDPSNTDKSHQHLLSIQSHVADKSMLALKAELKAQNKVADKWF